MRERLHSTASLTPETAIAIKEALKTMPTTKVARKFNVSQYIVRHIENGLTYKHVEVQWKQKRG